MDYPLYMWLMVHLGVAQQFPFLTKDKRHNSSTCGRHSLGDTFSVEGNKHKHSGDLYYLHFNRINLFFFLLRH